MRKKAFIMFISGQIATGSMNGDLFINEVQHLFFRECALGVPKIIPASAEREPTL